VKPQNSPQDAHPQSVRVAQLDAHLTSCVLLAPKGFFSSEMGDESLSKILLVCVILFMFLFCNVN